MAALAAALMVLEFRPRAPLLIDTQLKSGTHLTFVVIGPTSIPDDEYAEQVRLAKAAMRGYADSAGFYYSTVGISDNWNVERGMSILAPFGPFDELVVGRNWLNIGIKRYITDLKGYAAVPQVIVTIQDLRMDSLPIGYGELIELKRIVGTRGISEWAANGFALSGVLKEDATDAVSES